MIKWTEGARFGEVQNEHLWKSAGSYVSPVFKSLWGTTEHQWCVYNDSSSKALYTGTNGFSEEVNKDLVTS